jgi:single-strand DNA-binding protein
MSDLNHVTLIGRLTRDAEFKTLASGTALCNFSIAVGKSIPPKVPGGEWENETSFFDVTIWGKLAESKAPNLKKGKQVAIEGELRQDRWEKDGEKHSRVKINAESVQLLADPKGSATGGTAPAGDPGAFEDDIPF